MRVVLIYGAIAGLVAVSAITAALLIGESRHFHSEWFGYLVMLVALSLIFVGVKRHRDVECGGVIGFGRAFAVGLGIAVVAALFYSAGWEAFSALSDYDFMASYTANALETMRAEGASPAAIAAKAAEMKQFEAMYDDPLFRIPMTIAEILPVGLIIALISAAVLRNPRVLPARG